LIGRRHLHQSRPNFGWEEFAPDSPLEEEGFEPPVPPNCFEIFLSDPSAIEGRCEEPDLRDSPGEQRGIELSVWGGIDLSPHPVVPLR